MVEYRYLGSVSAKKVPFGSLIIPALPYYNFLRRYCISVFQNRYLLFRNNPVLHAELVEKLQKNLKITSKNLQTILKDVAQIEIEKLKTSKPKYFCLHRKEAEPDFMSIFVKELSGFDIFLFLSVGDEKTNGNVLIYGKENDVAELGPK